MKLGLSVTFEYPLYVFIPKCNPAPELQITQSNTRNVAASNTDSFEHTDTVIMSSFFSNNAMLPVAMEEEGNKRGFQETRNNDAEQNTPKRIHLEEPSSSNSCEVD